MKTATLPPVRVDPELRRSAEQVLEDGESLSSFVESSIRSEIAHRRMHAEFVSRGLASRASARQHGRYVEASEVLGKLEARLRAASSKAIVPK